MRLFAIYSPRFRNIVTSAGIQGLAQCIRLLVTIVTVPILLEYLGPDKLGLWFAALSFMALAGFMQQGMNGAVISGIARVGDNDERDRQINSALALGLLFFAASIPLAFLAGQLVPWHRLISSDGGAIDPATMQGMMSVLFICFGFSFVANVPKFALIGMTSGFVAHAIEAVASIVVFVLLVNAANFRQPLWVLIMCFSLARSVTVLVLGFGYLVLHIGAGIRPALIDLACMGRLAREGTVLGLNGAAKSVSNQSDLVLISLFGSLGGASIYGAVQRLFAIPTLFLSFVDLAMWPHLAHADAAGRHRWIRSAYFRVLSVNLVASIVFSGILAISIGPVLELWLGTPMAVSKLLAAGMAASCVLYSVAAPTSNLLRSLRQLRFLTRINIAMMIVNVPLSIFLILEIGAAGAIWGTVIAYTICYVVPCTLVVPRMLRDREPDLKPGPSVGKPIPSADVSPG